MSTRIGMGAKKPQENQELEKLQAELTAVKAERDEALARVTELEKLQADKAGADKK